MAFFRLIRLSNLLIVASTQVLIRQCVILPLLKQVKMEPQLPLSLFILLVIATVLITAGGYAINDYFDRKIDRVNKPQLLIVGKLIFPRHAMAYHLFFTIAGILLGTWVALRSEELYLSLVFFMVSGLLWPFLVLLFELPLLARNYGSAVTPITRYLLTWVLGFSLFAFLLNLMREIVKDAEDFEGDRAYGKNTIPVAWGISAARWILVALICLTIALLTFAWFWFVRDNVTLIYFITVLVIPLVIVAIMLLKGGDKKLFHKVSTWLKLIMLAGLGYMIVVNLIICHMQ
jgi:4-hydroxybenzoate polyprenyltransferase